MGDGLSDVIGAPVGAVVAGRFRNQVMAAATATNASSTAVTPTTGLRRVVEGPGSEGGPAALVRGLDRNRASSASAPACLSAASARSSAGADGPSSSEASRRHRASGVGAAPPASFMASPASRATATTSFHGRGTLSSTRARSRRQSWSWTRPPVLAAYPESAWRDPRKIPTCMWVVEISSAWQRLPSPSGPVGAVLHRPAQEHKACTDSLAR